MIDRPAAARRVTGLLAVAAALAAGLVAANPLGAPLAASAAEAAPGILTISASASRIAAGDLAFISVHRSGGADGVVGVSVDSQALPAELASVIAPIDTQVTFLDRDTADKVIPIVFLGDVPGGLPGSGDVPSGGEVPPVDEVPPGDDVPPTDPTDAPGLGGASARAATSVVADHAVARALAAAEVASAPFTVSLSAPTGGAALGTPSTVSLLVATPPTTTPVDGGSDSGGSSTGGTTTPGSATPGSSTKNSTKNSAGTTSPVGGDRSLADTGADVMLPFIGATLAAILGLAAVLFVQRRRTPESS